MAFAPHTEVGSKNILGVFREKEHGHYFEFSKPLPGQPCPYEGFEARLWVGPDANFRWCTVLKTVAYVVVDENADGSPVVETWQIKGVRIYEYEGA